MELKRASQKGKKLRIGLSGASGFGKTFSALSMGFGMTNDWGKICVLDSESSSASLYSHLGDYNIIDLQAPFTPEKFILGIKLAEDSMMDVIIIDSISMEWSGQGGCLDIHDQLGGRFQDWGPVKKRHQAFIDAILQSKCHIITCVRRKVEYSLDKDSNGRTKVFKLGTKEVTQEGYEYELDLNFELINENHLAKATKDRLGLYMNKPEFVINSATGKRLIAWVNATSYSTMSKHELQQKIVESMTIKELTELYNQNLELAKTIEQDFVAKKNLLQQLTSNVSSNGNGTH
ncbi:AAA family ATPase [Flavobacterium sp. ZS1P14]|uniref:AAA family ATPase n=1 Tax=Flavobacterium sp. ZS1P14 TaxID=3401729 RepID=UPI003AABAD9E